MVATRVAVSAVQDVQMDKGYLAAVIKANAPVDTNADQAIFAVVQTALRMAKLVTTCIITIHTRNTIRWSGMRTGTRIGRELGV